MGRAARNDRVVNLVDVSMPELYEALSHVGVSAQVIAATRIDGGNNARAWMITGGDRKFFAKQYFPDAEDGRDRLRSELLFLTFANRAAPEYVPVLVGASSEDQVLVTEFVDGESFAGTEIGLPEVEAAAGFVERLNCKAHRPSEDELAVAADAGFALRNQIDGVELRISRLVAALESRSDDDEFKNIVNDLESVWAPVRGTAMARLHEDGFDVDASIDRAQWIISPSDFGFHNALKRSDGNICFLDFEYAGWDDLTKLIGDFFAQIAVPVPEALRSAFVAQVSQSVSSCHEANAKAEALSDVFAVKWACIALNIFLPRGRERREFSGQRSETRDVTRSQIAAARRSIQGLDGII